LVKLIEINVNFSHDARQRGSNLRASSFQRARDIAPHYWFQYRGWVVLDHKLWDKMFTFIPWMFSGVLLMMPIGALITLN